MNFAYKVRDPLGKEHEGSLEAENVEEASQQLRRDGFQILEIDEASEGLALFAKRISRADIVYFTNQLAVMVDTGISLSSALDGILQQEQNPSLKKVLSELKNDVESGEDFSASLAKHPKLFDNTYVALVSASEATGSLGEMLDRIAQYLQKEMATRSKVRSAMAYPAVMAILAVGVTLFLLVFVLPQFMPMFSKKGMKLPGATVFMMGASNALIHYWYGWVALAVALIVGFVYGRRTAPGRQAIDWFKINAPVIGPLTRKVVISRSVRTLGTMIASGIPMLEALRLSSAVSGNSYYRALWDEVSDRVTEGSQVHEALSKSPLFPPTLVQMMAAGEQSGKLGQVLERVSSHYDQEVESSIKAATSIIEPIMISVMGVVVGGIAMALLLPIFKLSGGSG